MKKYVIVFTVLVLSGLVLQADRYPETASKEYQKQLTFSNPGQPKGLVIDNIFGAIRVTGHRGDGLVVDIKEELRARSATALEKAKREVELRITQVDNTITICVDGPFRRADGTINWCGDLGYIACYHFDVRVPRDIKLKVKTINEGNIRVENVEGLFYVSNVNGKVDMQHVVGSGTARTVNGGVNIEFDRNPVGACTFKTINGDVRISFLEDLSADFRLKTFNGEMYSAFPFIDRPLPLSKPKRTKGRFVYKRGRFQGIRIGKGGPDIVMDTFNGDIVINQKNNHSRR